jgi:hypothetical protein
MQRRPQPVTTVSLPSGRTLEVVTPPSGDPYTRVRDGEAQDRDLCMCEACGSDLVEPTDWGGAGEGAWRVELRCPNCEARTHGVFSSDSVDRFDERLDAGLAAIVGDLKRLEHANMADDVERFIVALASGAILPEDF